MIKRKYLQPKDMWARVENGNLLYVPVITIHGADHAHVYLSGQIARTETGEIVGKGDMRAQLRKVCENIGKGLAYAGRDLRRRGARDDLRHRHRGVLPRARTSASSSSRTSGRRAR